MPPEFNYNFDLNNGGDRVNFDAFDKDISVKESNSN